MFVIDDGDAMHAVHPNTDGIFTIKSAPGQPLPKRVVRDMSDLLPDSCRKNGHRGMSQTCPTNGHSRTSEAPLTPRKPSEFPCTSVRASPASQRARLRKKVRPYNAAEPRKSDRSPGAP